MIKRILATLALASIAILPTLPASAQGYTFGWGNGGWGNRANINREQTQLRQRIEFARSRGMLTAGEYNSLMRDFNRIAVLESRARLNGLSFRERQELNARLNNLEFRVNREMHDRQYAGRPRFW